MCSTKRATHILISNITSPQTCSGLLPKHSILLYCSPFSPRSYTAKKIWTFVIYSHVPAFSHYATNFKRKKGESCWCNMHSQAAVFLASVLQHHYHALHSFCVLLFLYWVYCMRLFDYCYHIVKLGYFLHDERFMTMLYKSIHYVTVNSILHLHISSLVYKLHFAVYHLLNEKILVIAANACTL